MDSFPVNCHNCFSHKREFYVYLECKHFICLSCCLCLVNFQTLTIRCCHRNTKMSEELTTAMFEEVKARKQSQSHHSDINSEKYPKNNVIRIETQPSSYQKSFKDTVKMNKQQTKLIDEKLLGESQVIQTFKRIDEQKNFDDKNEEKRNKQTYKSKPANISLMQTLKKPLRDRLIPFQSLKQTESPTFKQIRQETFNQVKQEAFPTQKLKAKYEEDGTKQNYFYWKNYDSSKDRILAKLNYHQQKMNNLIKQHYN